MKLRELRDVLAEMHNIVQHGLQEDQEGIFFVMLKAANNDQNSETFKILNDIYNAGLTGQVLAQLQVRVLVSTWGL